jgi:hypothetical protein
MLERLSVGTKIIILVIIGLVIIAGVILGFLYLRQEPEQEPPAPVEIDETQPPPREPIVTEPQRQPITLPELTEEEKSVEELQNLARIFAERYGSFSNQGGFQNIDDVQTLVTAEMKDWLEQKKQESMEKYPINGEYFGITTSAPISKVESFTEDKAMIVITTQRKETKNGETTNYNQDIKIEFTKQDGKWLISGAYWQ